MPRYTVGDVRNRPGMRKDCDSRDAHREHIWLDEPSEWYCPGFLGNLLPPEKPEGPEFVLGKGPNKRVGFHHIHSDKYECGFAYWNTNPWDGGDSHWEKCSRLVNHDGPCGYEDNSAY